MNRSQKPIEQVLSARVRGRALISGNHTPGAPLLVGCHGYAENAEHHLAALERLPNVDAWSLAAVEALHPFYNRRTREVVASWMTSRLRREAIEDNTAYLVAAVATLRRRFQSSRTLAITGFSQGVAMAYRAAAALGNEVQGLIVLAGDVPPDVVARWSEGRLLPRILLGRGTADAWYTEQKMAADLLALESLGAEVETCIFEGGHEWSPAFLTAASIFLARLVSRETAPPRDDSRRAPVESTGRECCSRHDERKDVSVS